MRVSVKSLLYVAVAALTLANSVAAKSFRPPPHAVTLWWVVFNQPDNCTASPGSKVQCGSVDIFGSAYLDSVANGAPDPGLIKPNLDAGLAVIYATGALTSQRRQIRLVASLYQGQSVADLPDEVDPMGLDKTLTNMGAEIHLVMRDHGARHPRDYARQITAFLDPYCSDPNLLYFSGPNTCQDVEFAVFGPGQTGKHDVYAFADPTRPLSHAYASLTRDGGVVQVIFETRMR